MSEEINIKQEQLKGKNGTQIGAQTNIGNMTINGGPSIEEITRVFTNLFLDNFPRLQKIAKETAEERIVELREEILSALASSETKDLSPFMAVDVQYMLYEAQKNYARFATPDLLKKLSVLILKKIQSNDEEIAFKATVDKAISIVGMLSSAQLDYLSLLFITSKVKFNNIFTLEDLKAHFEYLDSVFSYAQRSNWQHLNMLGCLQLDLPDICEINAKNYKLNISDVQKICPKNISNLSGDYSVSPLGALIGIIHAEQKTSFKFNPKIWIHN